MNRPKLKLLSGAALLLAAVVAGGCDLQENADLDNGRDQFVDVTPVGLCGMFEL